MRAATGSVVVAVVGRRGHDAITVGSRGREDAVVGGEIDARSRDLRGESFEQDERLGTTCVEPSR